MTHPSAMRGAPSVTSRSMVASRTEDRHRIRTGCSRDDGCRDRPNTARQISSQGLSLTANRAGAIASSQDFHADEPAFADTRARVCDRHPMSHDHARGDAFGGRLALLAGGPSSIEPDSARPGSRCSVRQDARSHDCRILQHPSGGVAFVHGDCWCRTWPRAAQKRNTMVRNTATGTPVRRSAAARRGNR